MAAKYIIGGPEARQLYAKLQSLGQETSQGIRVAASVTYSDFMHVLHTAPGTTVRINYHGRLSDFDRPEITLLTDHSADSSAKKTLESFAGFKLCEV
ncbi:MAG: hypothetical protein ABII03_06175 [Nanoarchaeota archaeon]